MSQIPPKNRLGYGDAGPHRSKNDIKSILRLIVVCLSVYIFLLGIVGRFGFYYIPSADTPVWPPPQPSFIVERTKVDVAVRPLSRAVRDCDTSDLSFRDFVKLVQTVDVPNKKETLAALEVMASPVSMNKWTWLNAFKARLAEVSGSDRKIDQWPAGKVLELLRVHLASEGYPMFRVWGVPGGFAICTPCEVIDQDGLVLPELYRWGHEGPYFAPELSVKSWVTAFSRIAAKDIGTVRFMIVVVTNTVVTPTKAVEFDKLLPLTMTGLSSLPPGLDSISVPVRFTVLGYQFTVSAQGEFRQVFNGGSVMLRSVPF